MDDPQILTVSVLSKLAEMTEIVTNLSYPLYWYMPIMYLEIRDFEDIQIYHTLHEHTFSS